MSVDEPSAPPGGAAVVIALVRFRHPGIETAAEEVAVPHRPGPEERS
jgi:hypothetical protein